MTTKIDTFKTLADFEALGKRIRTAAHTPFALVQVGLVAALTHLEKNGNVNVLKPIVTAIEDTFLNRGMVRRVRYWLTTYSWLDFNARDFKAKALRDAQFDTVWTKNKSKKMDIDGAKAKNWYEIELPGAEDAAPTDIEAYAKAFAKRLQKLIDGDKLMKGKSLATVAQVRTYLKAALEGLEAKHKVTTQTATVARKAGVKATKLPAGKARGHKPIKTPVAAEAKAA